MPCRNGVCSRGSGRRSSRAAAAVAAPSPAPAAANANAIPNPVMQGGRHGHHRHGGAREFFLGRGPRTMQFPTMTHGQQNVQNQMLQQLSGLLGNLPQGQFDFEPIAQQARQGFQTQTIPSIAERFTELGRGGTKLASSGYLGSLGAAGRGLETDLASLRSQYALKQQDLQQNLLRLLMGGGLQSRFNSQYMSRQPGFLENLFHGGAQAAGSMLPMLAML